MAVTAIAAVIAVGSPYIYSMFDGNSTRELAAPNPAASLPLPESALHSVISSSDRSKQVNRKVERERKQDTQIASRKR
ncbi:MAG TPA: hypothetical protein PLP21_13670 [Pyrinomonadaceae bacterium]|nr:hypothetical protein [Acidobacteriota bacterium]HQZ97365.1 hypothetical protein [Pyrinomonadaceae bacterium]